MALGGCRFINYTQHQTEVGVGNGGGVGKDARPGRSVWGDAVFLLWFSNRSTKINREMGGLLALDGRRLMGDVIQISVPYE